MANDIKRTLNNLFTSPEMNYILSAIERRDGLLGASSVIPNQALPVKLDATRKPVTIFINNSTFSAINSLRNIANKVNRIKSSMGKALIPFEFVCYGFREPTGDIEIFGFDIPQLEQYTNNKNEINLTAMASDRPDPKGRIDTTSLMYEHVYRGTNFPAAKGKELVSLLGIIRPQNELSSKKNAPTVRELADITIPGDVKMTNPFSTGILIIPPDDIIRTTDGYKSTPASLECVIMDNDITPSGQAKPTMLTNVTRCIWYSNEQEKRVPISQGYQNLSNLPQPGFIKNNGRELKD